MQPLNRQLSCVLSVIPTTFDFTEVLLMVRVHGLVESGKDTITTDELFGPSPSEAEVNITF